MGKHQNDASWTQALSTLVQQAYADIGGSAKPHESITQDIFARIFLARRASPSPARICMRLSGTKRVVRVSVQLYVQAL